MIAFIGSNQLIKKLPQKDKDAVTSRALHLLDIAITSYQRMITIFERDRFNRMGKLSINLKTLDEITVGEFFNAFDKISDSNYRNSELNIDQVLLGTLLDEANKLYEEVMSSENLTLFSTPMEEFTRQVNIWKQRKLRTSPVITSMIRNRKRLTRDHPEEISPAGWSFSQREASLFNNKEDLLEYIYEFRRFQRLSNIGYSDMDRALVIYNYFATSSPISEEEELGIYRYLKLEGRLKELNAEPSEEDVQFDVDSLPISTEVSDGELVHILELPGDLTPRKWQCIVGLGNLVNGESEGFSGFTEFDDVFYGYGSTKLAETLISLISILKDYKTQAAYEKDKSKEAEEFLSNTKDTFLKIIKDIKFLNNELITVDGEPQDFIFSFISFRNVSFSEMIQEIREIQSMDAESILRYMRKKLLVDPPEFDSILMCD
jgi:hypothetical protein